MSPHASRWNSRQPSPRSRSCSRTNSGRKLVVTVSRSSSSSTMTVGTAKLNRSPDGHKMLNHYALLHELGKGNNGEVRLVRDTYTGVFYACKSVNRPANGSPEDARGATRTKEHEACAGLRKEIALGSRLHHRNIVNMVEAIDDPTHKKIYVIMEYCAGGALMPDSEATVAIPPETARRYFGMGYGCGSYVFAIFNPTSTYPCPNVSLTLTLITLPHQHPPYPDAHYPTSIPLGISVIWLWG